MQSEDFKDNKDDSNDGPDWHSVLHVEVHKAVNLAASVEIALHEGVVPVEEDELLEEKRRGDFGLYH